MVDGGQSGDFHGYDDVQQNFKTDTLRGIFMMCMSQNGGQFRLNRNRHRPGDITEPFLNFCKSGQITLDICTMGVPGLLKALRSITNTVHVRDYKGQRAGIDAHCWLHKAAFGCSAEIAEQLPTTKYVEYFMSLIHLLVVNGVVPVVVFDGRSLPAKNITNSARREKREQSKANARQASEQGLHAQAITHYQRSIKITSEMVYATIKALQAAKIEYLVAPYEADPQLAYLSMHNHIDVVITEDSDALVYGCRRVLFKLNKDGYAQEILRRALGANTGLPFISFTDKQFKLMCCLSGCDYVAKLPSVGLITAHKLVSENETFEKLCIALQKYKDATPEYFEELYHALLTFQHQTIYNPTTASTKPLIPFDDLPEGVSLSVLGEQLSDEDAVNVCTGRVNPYTLQPYAADTHITDNVKESFNNAGLWEFTDNSTKPAITVAPKTHSRKMHAAVVETPLQETFSSLPIETLHRRQKRRLSTTAASPSVPEDDVTVTNNGGASHRINCVSEMWGKYHLYETQAPDVEESAALLSNVNSETTESNVSRENCDSNGSTSCGILPPSKSLLSDVVTFRPLFSQRQRSSGTSRENYWDEMLR